MGYMRLYLEIDSFLERSNIMCVSFLLACLFLFLSCFVRRREICGCGGVSKFGVLSRGGYFGALT